MTWSARRLGSAREALQRVRRGPHLLANRMVIEGLVPVAGLVGVHVATAEGAEVGRVADVVVRWGAGSYPAVTGLVVRVGLRRAFVHVEQVAKLAAEGVRLESARVDLRDFARRPGEVLLARDVIDHQLVDVDGARVVRASDLYLAPVAGLYRLVGVDVGMGAFLRRVGPAAMRRRVSPERVIDWADVAPFSAPGAPVRLRTSHERLRELHPAELADLLEDLGRAERHELLNALAPETAADVLEEMEPDELTELLRDAPPGEAAEPLAPDGAGGRRPSAARGRDVGGAAAAGPGRGGFVGGQDERAPVGRERVPVRTILTAIGLVLATLVLLWLIVQTRRVLVWVVVAAFFAVALYPVVNWVQRRLPWCRRSLATLLVFLLLVAVLGGTVVLFALVTCATASGASLSVAYWHPADMPVGVVLV